MNSMGIYYKKDICEELNKAGYSSYSLQNKGIITSATWTKLEKHKMISWDTLDKICTILQEQPENLIGYKYEETKND